MHGQSKRDIPLRDHPVDRRPVAADDGGADPLFSQTLTQRRDRVRWFDGNDFGTLSCKNLRYRHGVTPICVYFRGASVVRAQSSLAIVVVLLVMCLVVCVA